jgi:hypothetical protein
MPTDDPSAELREALATGVAAAADLLFALDAVRFGRPTTSADPGRRPCVAPRLQASRRPGGIGDALGSLPEPDAAADRVGEWFHRQFEGLGEEGA